MRINSLKLALAAACLLALAACDKSAKAPAAATPDAATPAAAPTTPAVAPSAPAPATTAPATPGPEMAGKFKAVKEACAADLQKFCADAEKPGKCLKEHESQLSASCNAARAAFRAARQAAKGQ